MDLNTVAWRYVRWLYRQASSCPDLALLVRVAGAVAALDHPPEGLADRVHDELAITMAALDDKRPELAIAIARLQPRSQVLAIALRHPAMRQAACAAIAFHLDDQQILDSYLALLGDPDPGVVTDALSGLGASPGFRQAASIRAQALTRPLPEAILACVVGLARARGSRCYRERPSCPGG